MIKELVFFVITTILFFAFVKGLDSDLLPKTINKNVMFIVASIILAGILTILSKVSHDNKDCFTFIPPTEKKKTCPYGNIERKPRPIPEYVKSAGRPEQKPKTILSTTQNQRCSGLLHGRALPEFDHVPETNHEWKSPT